MMRRQNVSSLPHAIFRRDGGRYELEPYAGPVCFEAVDVEAHVRNAAGVRPHHRPHALKAASRFEPPEQIAYSPHMEAAGPQLRIFIDANACPVKDEFS